MHDLSVLGVFIKTSKDRRNSLRFRAGKNNNAANGAGMPRRIDARYEHRARSLGFKVGWFCRAG